MTVKLLFHYLGSSANGTYIYIMYGKVQHMALFRHFTLTPCGSIKDINTVFI